MKQNYAGHIFQHEIFHDSFSCYSAKLPLRDYPTHDAVPFRSISDFPRAAADMTQEPQGRACVLFPRFRQEERHD